MINRSTQRPATNSNKPFADDDKYDIDTDRVAADGSAA